MPRSISNVAAVLDGLLNKVHELSGADRLQYVYDEKLSYETGIRCLRSDNNLVNDAPTPFPLLIFNRSVMRYNPHAGLRRSTTSKVIRRGEGIEGISDTQALIYDVVHGNFDFRFLYTTTLMEEMELFEIRYLAKAKGGESSISSFSVRVPEFASEPGGGYCDYYITWNDLEEKVIEIDSNYYKTLAGSATVTGMYFVAQDEPGELITKISIGIKGGTSDNPQEDLSACEITTP